LAAAKRQVRPWLHKSHLFDDSIFLARVNPYTPPESPILEPTQVVASQTRPLNSGIWLVGFLIFPFGSFICLRIARCISNATLLVGLIASCAVQIGLVSVLAKVEGEQLQPFIILSTLACFYILGMWQYLLGLRVSYWTPEGLRGWRVLGKFFGGFLLLALILNIASFHFQRS
jgi:hypothetical protein